MSYVKDSPLPPAPSGAGDRSYLDWSVHIRVKQYEYGKNFTVFVFLGDVPGNSDEWYSAPSYAGDFNVMVYGVEERGKGNDIFVQGVVHLNRTIAARSGLPSFDEDEVVPYLKEKLSWRVRTVSGGVIELDEKTSLEVTVFSVRVSMGPISDPTTLPSQGKPRYYDDITAGRPGGARTK
ncbi:hypothetical protein PHLGIDRAFT_20489 [Phlebiopsis gigantea 11061_1 CR5-6]|uniref:Tyrosinase C-terminal domain-containing protein n=1 Tax=Phlebiopsis gigantea (strain 11061_1 CR5-6) TaxID=745531 RepID=A0A0C3S099_PHLG1|nr:hypothetical protein PHLGIDRAFT_20489 [Phlebiopsis gigantea 11061_1 CR5-6]